MRQVQIPFGSFQYECESCQMNKSPTCTSCDVYLKEIDKLKNMIAKGKDPLTKIESVYKSHTCASCDLHLK